MELLGWIGSILLASCALPEVVYAFRYKRCTLTWGFLLLWGVGEAFILIPVIAEIKSPFLIFNYLTNILFVIILIYYKRRTK